MASGKRTYLYHISLFSSSWNIVPYVYFRTTGVVRVSFLGVGSTPKKLAVDSELVIYSVVGPRKASDNETVYLCSQYCDIP